MSIRPEHPQSSLVQRGTDESVKLCTLSLQDRLHTLLTRLSNTSKLLTKSEWPSADDSRIHHEKTTLLIESMNKILEGIKMVEEKSNEPQLYEKLRQIAIPLDLLDMMDFAGGINPDCFARGLLDEASRQLGNLQRRKTSMKILAKSIQNGIDHREKQLKLIHSLDERVRLLDAKLENHDAPMENDQEREGQKKRKRDDANEPEDAPLTKR